MSFLIGEVLAFAVSMLAGLAVNLFSELILPRLRQRFVLSGKKPPKSYKEQMAKLTRSLVRASSEVDHILQEMTQVSHQRETAITKLGQQLESLSERQKELQNKIDTLEKVPLPAVEYFASVVEKGEKRSAWRDYSLFGLGVIVSTVIAIVLSTALH